MARHPVTDTARDAIPFLVITAIWTVVSLVVYGLFLVTKPPAVDYPAWTYASVFAVPMVGFLGHTLKEALAGAAEGDATRGRL